MSWTQEQYDAVMRSRQKVARTARIDAGVIPCSPLSVGARQTGKSLTVHATVPRPSKHRNRKVTYDGHTFDSLKECVRYQSLKLLERVGAIRDLELQPEYDCYGANGERICGYRGDFRYYSIEHGKVIREDVKSRHTRTLPDYRIKFKLMRAQGTPITEIV